MLGAVRKAVLGISPAETQFERRGFECRDDASPGARAHLERIGATFVHGYHGALLHGVGPALDARLGAVPAPLRGFAYEGAAMGLAVVDAVTPWSPSRLGALLAGSGRDHVYLVHVGAGWAMARLPWRIQARLERLDPLLRWLAFDGYGFHHGYFDWRRSIVGQSVPRGLHGYATRAFDQGLGRSLWFVKGAAADRIARSVDAFPATRHADLWSGVGLAAAYAGGVGRAVLEALRRLAGQHAPHLAQGAAFAAKARERGRNPAPHTALACEQLCGVSPARASAVTDQALADLPADAEEPAYEVWRRRIRACLPLEVAT